MQKRTGTDLVVNALTPVKKMDVTHLVIERLRHLLEMEIIAPGSKLPTEHEMCKVLGVSRPSLRQAYKALDVMGIIRALPGDGTYINESTSKILSAPLTFLMTMKKISLDEIFEFRILLEVDLARLAATRASKDEIKEMKGHLETMELNLDQEANYLEAEYAFHNCLARSAHNGLLREIVSIIGGMLWETRKMLVNFVRDRKRDLQQHRAIYEAICSHDVPRAQAAMREHLLEALKLTKSDSFRKSLSKR